MNIYFCFAAESVGLPYLSAFLDSVGSNFSHGANFATAGSTVRPQNTTISQSGFSPISLQVQRLQYSDFLRRSQFFRKKGSFFFSTLIICLLVIDVSYSRLNKQFYPELYAFLHCYIC